MRKVGIVLENGIILGFPSTFSLQFLSWQNKVSPFGCLDAVIGS